MFWEIWRRFRLLKASLYKQIERNGGNKMSLLRSSEELRVSPLQTAWPDVQKSFCIDPDWFISILLTVHHFMRMQVVLYSITTMSSLIFFFPISPLGFSKPFFIFVLSAISLSIVCFSTATLGYCCLVFSPTFQMWSYTTFCRFTQFHAMAPPLQGDLGTDCQRALPPFFLLWAVLMII